MAFFNVQKHERLTMSFTESDAERAAFNARCQAEAVSRAIRLIPAKKDGSESQIRTVRLDRPVEPPTEYLVVADRKSRVLKSTGDWYEAVKLAKLIRRGGGSVTIFKSTKG